MRKLERRAIICLTLAAALLMGVALFTFRFIRDGKDWALFYGNQGIYEDGILASGAVYDRNGILLAENGGGTVTYNDDEYIRRGTLHAVGDMYGNISTGVLSAFKEELIGYNLITGTYRVSGENPDLTLTLDAYVSMVAYEELSDYGAGCIGIYNYKTGEIICMTSAPGFDPSYPDDIPEEDGIYVNRFISGLITPGSIFKTVTAAAAIDNMDYENFTYDCSGEREINGEYIRCTGAHGHMDFAGALRNSCNCAFSVMAEELGYEILAQYTERAGLTTSYNINGIYNEKGSFVFPGDADLSLGWAACGQYDDYLNPCSMLVYMGAVANGGRGAVPKILLDSDVELSGELLEENTADVLKEMMIGNVAKGYGEGSFSYLPVGAKTGTAEIEGKESHAWVCGFVDDPDNPYAFIVCLENGGSGAGNAIPVANEVLKACMGY